MIYGYVTQRSYILRWGWGKPILGSTVIKSQISKSVQDTIILYYYRLVICVIWSV